MTERCRGMQRDGTQRGFTALEVIITGSVLAVAACALVAALVNAMTLASVNRETATAAEAAREVVERLHGVPCTMVFRTFNADPYDDPNGIGTAPTGVFRFDPGNGPTADGDLTVQVLMPLGYGGRVREDVVNPDLGMPRDLNGDGEIDSLDHSGDYILLPIRVLVTWRGVTGIRTVESSTVLGDG